MKVYTRSGDKGETSLFTGERVPKNAETIDALGTVDECNTAIGAAISFLPKEEAFLSTREQLETIQHALFDLGAALATPRTKARQAKIKKTRFDPEETEKLEEWIDQMEGTLPALKTFILPGGHPCGAFLHLARSICRRTERVILPLFQQEDASENVLVYINRLSDYLFVASRYLNHQLGSPETLWEQHKVLREAT